MHFETEDYHLPRSASDSEYKFISTTCNKSLDKTLKQHINLLVNNCTIVITSFRYTMMSLVCVSLRSRLECSSLGVSYSGCHGVIFNEMTPLQEDICRFIKIYQLSISDLWVTNVFISMDEYTALCRMKIRGYFFTTCYYFVSCAGRRRYLCGEQRYLLQWIWQWPPIKKVITVNCDLWNMTSIGIGIESTLLVLL